MKVFLKTDLGMSAVNETLVDYGGASRGPLSQNNPLAMPIPVGKARFRWFHLLQDAVKRPIKRASKPQSVFAGNPPE